MAVGVEQHFGRFGEGIVVFGRHRGAVGAAAPDKDRVADSGLDELVGFEALFRAFHVVSFSNDLWRLDPRTDYLIAMFPEGFFLDATLWIAGSTVLEAAVILGASILFLRSRLGEDRDSSLTITEVEELSPADTG